MIPTEIRSWNAATRAAGDIWAADSLRGRFARGAVWSLIGAVIAQGSKLAASVIAARLLGREQFGEYGMIQSTVGMLGVFAGLGLGFTAMKYVAELRSRDPERAGGIIALGCAVAIVLGGLLAVALLAYAPVLAARTLNAPALANELRIASVLLFFNAINGAQTGALSGFEAFRAIARINLACGLLTFPITVGFVLLWRLPGAIWALALTAAVTCFFSQNSLRQHCAALGIWQFSSAWRERRVLWTFSTPVFLSGAVGGPVTWAANTMLVNQPGGYAEMGVFSAASQWGVRHRLHTERAAAVCTATPVQPQRGAGRIIWANSGKAQLRWGGQLTAWKTLGLLLSLKSYSQDIQEWRPVQAENARGQAVPIPARIPLASITGSGQPNGR